MFFCTVVAPEERRERGEMASATERTIHVGNQAFLDEDYLAALQVIDDVVIPVYQ